MVALGRPVGCQGKARRRAVVDAGTTLLILAVVVSGCPNDDVIVAVAVDVPRLAHRVAETGVGLIAPDPPVGLPGQARGRTVEDICPAFLNSTPEVSSHDDIRV